MATATLTSKGQVTLPKSIRDHLHVDAGDRLEFAIQADGSVRIEAPRSRLDDLEGMLRRTGRRAVSLDEMRQAIEREGGKPG